MQEQVLEKNVLLRIPLESTNHALLACEVLNVDDEIKRSGVKRHISINEETLLINLAGNDLKRLRVSANSILKNIILISKTLNQFAKS